jgi:hypothetical protein
MAIDMEGEMVNSNDITIGRDHERGPESRRGSR